MGLSQELSSIKTLVSDGVKANKVSRFAYTEKAYTQNTADGVSAYDVNAEQNIPLGTAEVMKVNQTVIEKGWRARASSLTRMLMNHFLGRISYNLNKANDMINSILGLFISYIGNPDGIASLDSNAQVPVAQINKSDVGVQNGANSFSTKGAYDYSLGSVTASSWLGKVFGKYLGRLWRGTEIGTTWLFTPYFADGLWVTGSKQNGLWWSEDGKSWNRSDKGANVTTYYTPTHHNDLWVCGSNDGMWWSENGKNWNRGDVTSFKVYTPVFANGLWVAGTATSGNNSKSFLWSEDGKHWYEGTGCSNTILKFTPVFRNGLWLAGTAGAGMWWSEDGKLWTQCSGTNNEVIFNPVYGNMKWVAGSSSGLWSSSDGKTWSKLDNALKNAHVFTPIYSVLVDDVSSNSIESFITGSNFGGGIFASVTGEASDWTNVKAISATVFTPSYANGLFIAGTISNATLISKDGKNWVSSGTPGVAPDSLKYANGMWIVGVHDDYYQSYWTSGMSPNGLRYSDVDMLKEEGIIVD